MLTKTLLAITTALVVATSIASTANAQRNVLPFTQAEQNWFDTAEGRDDGMPRHR